MNTEKVFIGYDKEGNERLLYKKNGNTYIDLLSKDNEVVNLDDIDMNFIIPFKVAIKNKDNMFKHSIVKSYNKDRNQMIDLAEVYCGKICEIHDVKKQYYGDTSSLFDYMMTGGVHTNYNLYPKYLSLFTRENESEYVDIINKKTFLLNKAIGASEMENGMYCVTKDYLFSINDGIGYMNKKDLMEYYYEINRYVNNNPAKVKIINNTIKLEVKK